MGTTPTWFIGIGAQKAGTTWLSHNLRRHPDIWDLPLKAFQYFTEPLRPPIVRALEPGAHNARWRHLATRQLPAAFVVPQRWRHAPWLLRFALWPRTDNGYRALMTPPPGKIGGEVTPAYSRLDDAGVARVHRVVPQARIIYLLRDPVGRAWSQAAMHWRKKGQPDLGRVPTLEVLDFLSRESPRLNSNYLRTLSIWERYYPREQIHVDFLERIAAAPGETLMDIFRFIGVEHRNAQVAPSQPKNVGSTPPMPDAVARFLGNEYLEPCREYHRRFNNAYTAAWLERCERLAQS